MSQRDRRWGDSTGAKRAKLFGQRGLRTAGKALAGLGAGRKAAAMGKHSVRESAAEVKRPRGEQSMGDHLYQQIRQAVRELTPGVRR
jgi:hypothetical protein